jgi:hypothetical protein
MESSVTTSDMREILVENGVASTEGIYTSNYITTGRYSKWNVIPKNLFEQF